VFRQVPVLPVATVLAAVVFAALAWSLSRRGRLSWPRVAVALALCVYAAGVVANAVFPVFLDKPVASTPWSSHLAVVPFEDYELADAVMNIVVFVPVGILVPLLLARISWWRAVAAAAAFSLAIEVTQYVTAHLLGGGHIADVNDLIFNVLGGAVGFGLFRSLVRVPSLDRFISRFRWHEDDPRATAGDVTAQPRATSARTR
jgi:glycopeptide antibiotics resistance protein